MAQNPNIDVPAKGDRIPEFVETAVFKRDVFSETRAGYFAGDPDTRIIRRVVSAAPGGRSHLHGFWRDAKFAA